MKQTSLHLLDANLQDIRELLEIPKLIRGHRNKILQLNKTAIVFITASFERFIEALAEDAFHFLLQCCKRPEDIPDKIRNLVAARFINSSDPRIPWTFAGDGWQTVLLKYRDEIVKKHVGSFNTPTPDNIDSLFSELIGLRHVSTQWSFQPKRYNAVKIYTQFLTDRHVIVHRNEEPTAPSIFYARRYLELVEAIAPQTAAIVDGHLRKLINAPMDKKQGIEARMSLQNTEGKNEQT